jgi:hypothetical protein
VDVGAAERLRVQAVDLDQRHVARPDCDRPEQGSLVCH